MPKVLQFGCGYLKNMKKTRTKENIRWFSHSCNVLKNTTKWTYNMSQIFNIIVCKESNAQQFYLQGACIQAWSITMQFF